MGIPEKDTLIWESTPQSVMEGYWQKMPEWMQLAFRTEPLINQGVTRCAHMLYSTEQMLFAVCEMLFAVHMQFCEAELRRARMEPIKTNGNHIITP